MGSMASDSGPISIELSSRKTGIARNDKKVVESKHGKAEEVCVCRHEFWKNRQRATGILPDTEVDECQRFK
jgi:hypothetical protein